MLIMTGSAPSGTVQHRCFALHARYWMQLLARQKKLLPHLSPLSLSSVCAILFLFGPRFRHVHNPGSHLYFFALLLSSH
jgi:type II secretory pathway component PulM